MKHTFLFVVVSDPHFMTTDGTHYEYHGEWDLILARSMLFDAGLGLEVHGRTKFIDGLWSLISHAAVRIGQDVFEVTK
jgi:hypothetical protein